MIMALTENRNDALKRMYVPHILKTKNIRYNTSLVAESIVITYKYS